MLAPKLPPRLVFAKRGPAMEMFLSVAVISLIGVAVSALLESPTGVRLCRCDQKLYEPAPPATYSTVANWVFEESNSKI